MQIIETSCAHRFVVRDGNSFLCRECDGRFSRHPEVMKEEWPILDPAKFLMVLEEFKEGSINLYKFAKELEVSPHQASEFIRNTFEAKPVYEEMYSLGSKKPISIQMGNMPYRTSDPLEVDAYFKANVNKFLDAQYSVRYDTYDEFPDITNIDMNVDAPPFQTNLRLRPISIDQPMYYMIKFNDGSIQRVDI